jgi:hypothetical protein
MKKHSLSRMLCCLLMTAALAFACASAPSAEPPAWVRNLRDVYPDSDYIVGLGEGSTRDEAENKAMAELSTYFIRQICVERSSQVSWTTLNEAADAQSKTQKDILVESQTRLMAVCYAQDPYFNAAAKSWSTLAFIDRDEGWRIYEPTAKKQTGAFLALVKAADEEADPLSAVLRYENAAAYTRSAEFSAVRDFAQVLHPQKAEDLFGETDDVLMALPEKTLSAAQKAPVYIECPVDFDGMVYQAMVRALASYGLAAETDRAKAAAVCLLQVEEGRQSQGSGFTYYPSLSGSISGQGGAALLSFKVEGKREGAINPDLARRRAYTSLAAALEASFAAEVGRLQAALANK